MKDYIVVFPEVGKYYFMYIIILENDELFIDS